jgi:Holliday junction resolvase RusA-like endonuclease
MSQTISLVVFGDAQPAGSKRGFNHPHTGRVILTDANPRSREWKDRVAAEAGRTYSGPLLDGPVAVSLTFYRTRPKGHLRTGKHAGLVRNSAPLYPVTKPDGLKLARGAEDAMTGIIYRDDAQVVDMDIHKRYGSPARVEIEVETLDPETVGEEVLDTQLALVA